MKWIAVVIAVVMIPACQTRATSDASADSTAVLAVAEQYRQAWLKSDTAMALGVLSDDVRFMIPGVPDISGQAGARALITGEMAAWSIPSLTINRQELVVRGDHAIDIGTYEETMVPKRGATVHGAGRYMIVWRREPAGWRMFRFMINNQDTTVANRPS